MLFKLFKGILIIGVIISLVIFVGNVQFTQVTCVSQFGACNEEVVASLKSVTKPTLFSATRELSAKLKANIFVEKYTFQILLPRKIIVHVIQKKPVYLVFDDFSNQKFLIDSSGVVLVATGDSEFFPLHVSSFPFLPGDRVGDSYLFALEIVSALSKNYDLTESILKSESLEIILEDGVFALFPLDGDRDYLTGAFVLMYNQLNNENGGIKIDNNNINSIDLRFRDPVLTTRI